MESDKAPVDTRTSAPIAQRKPTCSDITVDTIAEAEKLSDLHYTVAEREEIIITAPHQVAAVKELRQVTLPYSLPSAVSFDPRLPGKSYPPRIDCLQLSPDVRALLPNDNADIAYAPVTSLGNWIRTGQLTSRRLTTIYLSRIARIAPTLNCFITITGRHALAQADAMDRELASGRYRGPLHGIPYALKDLIDTAGIPTTWGSSLYVDRVTETDAIVVSQLREAGAVLLGKTATGELANGYQWFGGACRNPWSPEEASGGSSAGSAAATAAGLCGFSLGTDTLGSILNPADRCGVVGLRPTFGRVAMTGCMPVSASLDRIGPICRTVEDAAIVLSAIRSKGHDSQSLGDDIGVQYDSTMKLSGLKVGYSPQWFNEVGFGPGTSAPVSAAHRQALAALKALGIQLVLVELPNLPYTALLHVLFVDAAATFEELTLSNRDDLLGATGFLDWPSVWRQARLLSAVDYVQLQRFRRLVMEALDAIFEQVDVLFGPTYGCFNLIVATNFSGHPGLTLRAGFDSAAARGQLFAPVDPNGPKHVITQNVAFHGRLFEEGTLLAIARALEARLNVWHSRPPVG